MMPGAFQGIDPLRLPQNTRLYQGKVRDVVDLGDKLLMVASDRISAFDRILGTVPAKGEILNRISQFWFEQTKDIVENHLIEEVLPRAVAVKKAKVLPVEVIVRGYLTGSLWRDYSAGRTWPGVGIPAGMKNHQAFPQPIMTPTTKAAVGDHDRPIGWDEIIKTGLVAESLWFQVEKVAFALFRRGQEILARQGLILVDTKYEFGVIDGRLVLVDEIHTPDSSRFWFADDYAKAFAEGREPKKLDKEYLRQWLLAQGFSGEGKPPVVPAEVYQEVYNRYAEAFDLITGTKFVPSALKPEAQMEKLLSYMA